MATKIVYNTADGLEVLAHEDQVTAGLFHLPANSTEVKPPSFDKSIALSYEYILSLFIPIAIWLWDLWSKKLYIFQFLFKKINNLLLFIL